MSKRLGSSASPPGPLSTYVERGRAIALLTLVAVLACRPASPLVTTDSATTTIPAGDTLLVVENPIRTAFLERYAGLERIGGGWGELLYPKGRGRSVDKLRSELPVGHLLHTLDGLDAESRVFAVIALSGADSVYVVHSDGPSGDPSFSFAYARTGAETNYIWGEILVIPDSGPLMMYQRTNAYFPTVKEVRLREGRFEEVPMVRRSIGLRTVALDTITLWRSPTDSTSVAHIVRGDSVVVVEAASKDGPLLIHTSAGLQGWTNRMGYQCYGMPFRGICYLGD